MDSIVGTDPYAAKLDKNTGVSGLLRGWMHETLWPQKGYKRLAIFQLMIWTMTVGNQT